jgi:hypothetical protein
MRLMIRVWYDPEIPFFRIRWIKSVGLTPDLHLMTLGISKAFALGLDIELGGGGGCPPLTMPLMGGNFLARDKIRTNLDSPPSLNVSGTCFWASHPIGSSGRAESARR